MANNNIDLDKVLNDENLTKEQKVAIIQNHFDNYRANIDKELNDYIFKQRLGAALEIGSAAIPVGGVGKIGGAVGKEILKKQLGRKISQEIGSGVSAGAFSGSVFGLGEGLMNDEINPIASTVAGATSGAVFGGALGGTGSEVERILKGYQLKNYGNIDILDNTARKQYSNDAKNFYKDYIQEIQLEKNEPIDFSKRGVQEQLRWNPHQAQNFSELLNDIKNAERLPDAPNMKPEQKPEVSHYEVYRGKNGDHYVEVSESGKRRFYITKDTPSGSDHATSTGATRSSNSVIPDIAENFNPKEENPNILYGGVEMNVGDVPEVPTGKAAGIDYEQLANMFGIKTTMDTVEPQQSPSGLFGYINPLTGNNRIFTREDIGAMSKQDFAKHEIEIQAQMNTIGVPTNGDMKRESMTGGGVVYVNSYKRADGTEVKGYYRSKPNRY